MKKFTLILFFGFCLFAFAARAQVANTDTTDVGVLINGVVWATRNVDAPGAFAATPEDIGMIYQYNIRVGWRYATQYADILSTNGSTVWNTTQNYNPVWEAANDPCPNGWRVPTIIEAQSLIDAGSYIMYGYASDGYWKPIYRVYGSSVYGETDNTIFLNTKGWADMNTGICTINNLSNAYWCNSAGYDNINDNIFYFAYAMGTGTSAPYNQPSFVIDAPLTIGHLIRCVKANMDTIECMSTLNVFSSDNDLGYVQVVHNTQPILSTLDSNSVTFCGVAELIAIPKENAVFTGWTWHNIDGININPISFMVMQDTSITANFTAINTDIENISAGNINIYLNSATSELTINIEQLTINNVEILDITGKRIYNLQSKNYNSIDISLLSQGLYLLKIYTDKGVITQKFIKK